MEKAKTCTFTGNRPQKLPWGNDENDYRCVAVKNRIAQEIESAVSRGYDTFISGMALGGDTYFAEEVLKLKKHKNIKLVCALPCPEQPNGWSKKDADRYGAILAQADEIVYTGEKYTRFCMHVRNRYMVEHSSMILALDCGEDGGTKYTRELALKKKLQIVDLF